MQWTLLLPVVLLLILTLVQLASWTHGRHTVRHAAAAAAEAAAISPAGGSEAAARRAAESVAASGGLDSLGVTVSVTADRVDVSTTARVALIVDLGLSQVSAQASAPRERVS